MSLSEQNIREKEFHNKLQSSSKGRFENIFYKAILNAWEDFYDFLNLNAKNSEILVKGSVKNIQKKTIQEKIKANEEAKKTPDKKKK